MIYHTYYVTKKMEQAEAALEERHRDVDRFLKRQAAERRRLQATLAAQRLAKR